MTQNKELAWSYSRLTSFETCPKKYWHQSVNKDVMDVKGDMALYGDQLHKALDARISKKKPLPIEFAFMERIAKKFDGVNGKVLTEQKLAINRNFEPTGWFSKDTWCRAIIDLAVISGSHALIIDWKTGRMSDDFTQQHLCGTVLMLHQPEVQSMDVSYYWVADKKLTSESLDRDDIKHVWSMLLPRVQKYEAAHTAMNFPARKNGLCRKHCAVKSCPYNGG